MSMLQAALLAAGTPGKRKERFERALFEEPVLEIATGESDPTAPEASAMPAPEPRLDRVSGPSLDQIAARIRALDWKEHTRVSLLAGESIRLDAGGSQEEGLVLQFLDGTPGEVYRAESGTVPVEDLVLTFQGYTLDNGEWVKLWEWEVYRLKGCFGTILLVGFLAVLLGGAALGIA